jgi:hypothetical protein
MKELLEWLKVMQQVFGHQPNALPFSNGLKNLEVGSPSCMISEPFDSSALEIPKYSADKWVLRECAKTLLRVFELV